MKNKRLVLALAAALTLVFCLCSCKNKKDEVVGKWMCDMYGSAQIIEFTSDGKFIDYSTMSENKYKIKDGKIETYVEGEEDSKVAVSYSVDGDKLYFGGAEYERVYVK
ncbi:MAG: hypothetical protein K6D98_04550 [Clostridiales bacterium]|nr:hypothetical protein [Clostridiales bacterium]